MLQLIWCVTVLLLAIQDVTGELTGKPEDVLAIRGDSAAFRCRTNLSVPVSWSHRTMRYIIPETIYVDGELPPDNNDKYAMNDSAAEGRHDLIIKSVQVSDAGRYICRDNNGFAGEDVGVAELTVLLNSTISCSENFSVVQRGSEEREVVEVLVECTFSYAGNAAPSVEWFDARRHQIISTTEIADIETDGELVHTVATSRIVVAESLRPLQCVVSFRTTTNSSNSTNVAYVWTSSPAYDDDGQFPVADNMPLVILVTCSAVFILCFAVLTVALAVRNCYRRRSTRCWLTTKQETVEETALNNAAPVGERLTMYSELYYTFVASSADGDLESNLDDINYERLRGSAQ